MAYLKRFICLANSVKYGGFCIAGREILPDGSYGGWLRPVSTRPTAELSFMEPLYADNESPRLLDVIDVPLARPHALHHQTENHQIDPSLQWRRLGRLPKRSVAELCDLPSSLWINGEQTSGGCNNCVTADKAAKLKSSLYLISVSEITMQVRTASRTEHARFTYKGNFTYNSAEYFLNLTDPIVIDYLCRKGLGKYRFDNVYLTVSLTEPFAFDNRCHKLIAAVMRKPSA